MFELFVLLAFLAVAAVAIGLLFAVLHVVGQVVGSVFGFLGWLISLPFTILGWLFSGIGAVIGALVTVPIVLLVLFVPLVVVALAFGAVLLFALAPVLLVAGGVWLLVRVFAGGRRRTQTA